MDAVDTELWVIKEAFRYLKEEQNKLRKEIADANYANVIKHCDLQQTQTLNFSIKESDLQLEDRANSPKESPALKAIRNRIHQKPINFNLRLEENKSESNQSDSAEIPPEHGRLSMRQPRKFFRRGNDSSADD